MNVPSARRIQDLADLVGADGNRRLRDKIGDAGGEENTDAGDGEDRTRDGVASYYDALLRAHHVAREMLNDHAPGAKVRKRLLLFTNRDAPLAGGAGEDGRELISAWREFRDVHRIDVTLYSLPYTAGGDGYRDFDPTVFYENLTADARRRRRRRRRTRRERRRNPRARRRRRRGARARAVRRRPRARRLLRRSHRRPLRDVSKKIAKAPTRANRVAQIRIRRKRRHRRRALRPRRGGQEAQGGERPRQGPDGVARGDEAHRERRRRLREPRKSHPQIRRRRRLGSGDPHPGGRRRRQAGVRSRGYPSSGVPAASRDRAVGSYVQAGEADGSRGGVASGGVDGGVYRAVRGDGRQGPRRDRGVRANGR